MILLLLACIEQNFQERHLDSLAVVLGDFDHVQDDLIAMDLATTEYDGLIVQATYEPADDRTIRGEKALTVENLLSQIDDKGRYEIELYQAAFINSGTRGLNAWQYNNPLLEDDSLLLAPELIQRACDFVDGGGTLVVSDWSYDLVEACWPDAIEFAGEDTEIDAAQLGQPVADLSVTVGGDDKYRKQVGDTVALTFDYSAWAVMESVGKSTETLLSGDIYYQPSSAELPELLSGVPLLVRFQPGRGQVVFSSFHWGAQGSGLAQTLLTATIEGLSPSSSGGNGG